MVNRKLSILVLCAAILAVAISPAFAKREIRWGSVAPTFHGAHQGITAFANYVEEKTKGEIKINIFPNSQLGGEMSLTEQVQSGTLEITQTTTAVLSNTVKAVALLDLPFIFPSPEVAYAVLDDPDFQEKLFASFKGTGMVALGYAENGWRDFTNSRRPIRKPEDLKGLKIRVMQSPIYLDTVNQLGASAVPMAFSEVYNALQQRVVDGQENPLYTSVLMKFTEVQKYGTLSSHQLSAAIIVANENLWKSLTEDEQKIFREAAKVCTKVNRDVNSAHFKKLPKIDKSVEEAVKEQGMELIKLTPEERAAFAKVITPVWEKYRKFSGEQMYDLFLKTIGKHSK